MRVLVVAALLGMQAVSAQAPVERRPPPPPVGAQAPQDEDNVQEVPVAKPAQSGAPQSGSSGSPTGGFPTIKVETRLVNIALNVVDAKGAPVGRFGVAQCDHALGRGRSQAF